MYRILFSQKLIYRVFRHLILFLTMVLSFTWIIMFRSHHPDFVKAIIMVIVNALFFFGYSYLTIYILIPSLVPKRRFILFFIFFLAAGFLFSALKFMGSDIVLYQSIAPENYSSSGIPSLRHILINTKDMTFIVALFTMTKYAKDHYLVQSNIRELEKKALEAEAKLLDHHLDPHVIFNNFNSLYSISITRPELLEPTVRKIRTILHYLFGESRENKILLGREIEMIENYIGLEQLRYGERLDVQVEKSGDSGSLRIAPLILYSFVENCFVHGACEDTRKSWIRIGIRIEDSRLQFTAANSVSERIRDQREPRTRSTSENSLRRLELQYPNSHRLTIRENRSEYHVALNMIL
jgi:LytS/YehU family sensor histidine kinase